MGFDLGGNALLAEVDIGKARRRFLPLRAISCVSVGGCSIVPFARARKSLQATLD